MKCRCVVLRGEAPLCITRRKGAESASLAGGDGPAAGGLCPRPSLAAVHLPHLCSGCLFCLDPSCLTLLRSEVIPPLSWGPLLAPDPPPSGPGHSVVLVCLPAIHPETPSAPLPYAHLHLEGCELLSPCPHPPHILMSSLRAGAVGVFPAPSTGWAHSPARSGKEVPPLYNSSGQCLLSTNCMPDTVDDIC